MEHTQIQLKYWVHTNFLDGFIAPSNCYKSVQRFTVTCLFTGQYDTGEYGTIVGVIFLLSIFPPSNWDQTNTIVTPTIKKLTF